MENLNSPQIIRGPLTESDLLDKDFGNVPAPAEAATELGADCEPLTVRDWFGVWFAFMVAVCIVAALAGVVYALAS